MTGAEQKVGTPMDGITLSRVNLNNQKDHDEINEFLLQSGLILDEDVDYTIAARRDDVVVGTCSKAGRVIKCLAVSPQYRGEGLSAELVKELIDRLFEEAIYHYFVFTQPHNTKLFESLNFKMLYKGDQAALLEGGIVSIEQRLTKLKHEAGLGEASNRIALVMNCNPFTLGHLHLVEQAAATGREVLLFVVEENRSVFSFSERFAMVRAGTAHLSNVHVLPGTEYIISNATFPSYFLREADARTTAYMEMDAQIFCTWFSPIFGITTRYVGEEPYCALTLSYNHTLRRVLEGAGLELIVVPRIQNNAAPISASQVRRCIREGQDDLVRTLVPESTRHFIYETPEGRKAAERVRNSESPH